MRYFIWNIDLAMPIACQPEEGYTMTEAVARHSREVRNTFNVLKGRFPDLTEKEVERWYGVREYDGKEFGEFIL